MRSAAEQYAAMYAPAAADLIRTLPDVGVGLQEQFRALSALPTAAGCDHLSMNLAGAQTAVRKLREALIREGGADGQ